MKHEFYDVYTQLFEKSLTILRRTIKIKLKAIRFANKFLRYKDQGCKHTNEMLSRGLTTVLNDLKSCDSGSDGGYKFKPIEQEEVEYESSLFDTSLEDEEEISKGGCCASDNGSKGKKSKSL